MVSNPPTIHENTIGFRNASFTWRTDAQTGEFSGVDTPRRRNFRLSIEGDLVFKPGKVNLIIGPTGCGGYTTTISAIPDFIASRQIVSFNGIARRNAFQT